MRKTCMLCLRAHRGDGDCGPACAQRAAIPTTNDLMVTAGRAALGRSRAARGVQQSSTVLFARNAAALEVGDE